MMGHDILNAQSSVWHKPRSRDTSLLFSFVLLHFGEGDSRGQREEDGEKQETWSTRVYLTSPTSTGQPQRKGTTPASRALGYPENGASSHLGSRSSDSLQHSNFITQLQAAGSGGNSIKGSNTALGCPHLTKGQKHLFVPSKCILSFLRKDLCPLRLERPYHLAQDGYSGISKEGRERELQRKTRKRARVEFQRAAPRPRHLPKCMILNTSLNIAEPQFPCF